MTRSCAARPVSREGKVPVTAALLAQGHRGWRGCLELCCTLLTECLSPERVCIGMFGFDVQVLSMFEHAKCRCGNSVSPQKHTTFSLIYLIYWCRERRIVLFQECILLAVAFLSHLLAVPGSAAHPVILFLSRLVRMKDHYPSTYAEAQCLCSGCIFIQDNKGWEKRPLQESNDYNSVPIKQSRVFLKRELCSDGKKYQLKPVTLEVAVACTCARVKTSS